MIKRIQKPTSGATTVIASMDVMDDFMDKVITAEVPRILADKIAKAYLKKHSKEIEQRLSEYVKKKFEL